MDEPILTAVPAPGTTGRGDEAREPAGPLTAVWLGRVAYRPAWALQKRLAAERAAGRIGDRLLLLEHEPVLTLGRHADPSHVLVAPEVLARRRIDLVRVERGGEVTYHGPGQLVAYPIVALADRGIGIRAFVRILEGALAATCAAFGVEAGPRAGHPGCWCDPDGPLPRKIGALGLRVERGVTYHGIALNVDLDLTPFELIHPCGLPGLRSTSIAAELARACRGDPAPSIVEAAWRFARALADGLGVELVAAPPDARFVGTDGGTGGGQDRQTGREPAVDSPDDALATSGGPDAVRRARAG